MTFAPALNPALIPQPLLNPLVSSTQAPSIPIASDSPRSISGRTFSNLFYNPDSTPDSKKLDFFESSFLDDIPLASCKQEEVFGASKKWLNTVHGRLVGRHPHVPSLRKHLVQKWELKGSLEITLQSKETLIFRFGSDEDKEHVLCNGPWFVAGHVLILKPWCPNISSLSLDSIPIWIQLPELPLEFWTRDSLGRIGSTVGRPLFVDNFTADQSRTRFARICVEIEAAKQLPDFVWIDVEGRNRFSQKISYEWEPAICSKCRKFFHSEIKCPLLKAASVGVSGKDDSARLLHNREKGKDVLLPNSDPVVWTEVRHHKSKRSGKVGPSETSSLIESRRQPDLTALVSGTRSSPVSASEEGIRGSDRTGGSLNSGGELAVSTVIAVHKPSDTSGSSSVDLTLDADLASREEVVRTVLDQPDEAAADGDSVETTKVVENTARGVTRVGGASTEISDDAEIHLSEDGGGINDTIVDDGDLIDVRTEVVDSERQKLVLADKPGASSTVLGEAWALSALVGLSSGDKIVSNEIVPVAGVFSRGAESLLGLELSEPRVSSVQDPKFQSASHPVADPRTLDPLREPFSTSAIDSQRNSPIATFIQTGVNAHLGLTHPQTINPSLTHLPTTHCSTHHQALMSPIPLTNQAPTNPEPHQIKPLTLPIEKSAILQYFNKIDHRTSSFEPNQNQTNSVSLVFPRTKKSVRPSAKSSSISYPLVGNLDTQLMPDSPSQKHLSLSSNADSSFLFASKSTSNQALPLLIEKGVNLSVELLPLTGEDRSFDINNREVASLSEEEDRESSPPGFNSRVDKSSKENSMETAIHITEETSSSEEETNGCSSSRARMVREKLGISVLGMDNADKAFAEFCRNRQKETEIIRKKSVVPDVSIILKKHVGKKGYHTRRIVEGGKKKVRS